jgi:lipopolysaccharide export system protein LptA
MNPNRRLVFSLFFLSVGIHGAFAEKKDREQKIMTQADEVTIDQQKDIATLEGNVVITQGTLKMKAKQVVIVRDSSGQQTFNAVGSPVYFEQKLEGKKEWLKGQGDRIVYTSHDHQVILSGKAKVERSGDVVTGDSITYNTETEVYKASGSGKNSRVNIILQPKSSK